MKRVAAITALVLATLLLIGLLWQFRSVITLLLLALAVTAALRPPIDRLVLRGWPRGAALLFVYALTLTVAAAIIGVIGPPLLGDLREITDQLSLVYDQIWMRWPEGTAFQRTVAQWLPPPEDLYDAIGGTHGEAIIQQMLGVTRSVFGLLSQLAIMLVLSMYLGLDQARFERLWLSVLPPEKRTGAREIWRSIETGVGAYIRSEVIQSLLAGCLLGLGYAALGLPYPTLLALGSSLAWLIPWLGAGLALLPVSIIAWAVSPAAGLLAVVYTVAVLLVLEFWVEPRLYNRRQFNSLLIVLMLLALGEAFGLVGLLVAPPLAAAVQILFSHLLTPRASTTDKPVDEQYLILEERLASVRAALAAAEEPPAPQVTSLIERLEALVATVGRTLQGDGQLSPEWAPSENLSAAGGGAENGRASRGNGKHAG